MDHLTPHDYASALDVLARIEAKAGSASDFAHATADALAGFVGAERTTLLVCDLLTGYRHVVGLPDTGDKPGDKPGGELGNEPDNEPDNGLDHVIACCLFESRRTVVTVVLKRRSPGFDARDRERLALLRPHLAFVYQNACQARTLIDTTLPAKQATLMLKVAPCELTHREAEVLHWLARAKTDADIAALLCISPRTVQKHLEHIYIKLGVETRMAAVMRALAGSAHNAHLIDQLLPVSE